MGAIILYYYFFATLIAIYVFPCFYETAFFKTVFFHERCHWFIQYIFRKCMRRRIDCIIMIREDLFKSMSKAKQERAKKFVHGCCHKKGLRVGLRSSEERTTKGTCYTPSVEYRNKNYYLFETLLSLVAPYYGRSLAMLPVAFTIGLLESRLFSLPLGVIHMALFCLLFYFVTPILFVLFDSEDKEVKENMDDFFSTLRACETEEAIRSCLILCPPISDAYKLRHIRWYVDTVEKYEKEINKACTCCGIPYFDEYDEIATKLTSGVYYEL